VRHVEWTGRELSTHGRSSSATSVVSIAVRHAFQGRESYTRMLWIAMKKEAAYLPG
jgi:hypothetical protein